MEQRASNAGVLVIMELGSEWPSWLSECCRGMLTRRVIVQEEAESLDVFCDRVAARIDTMITESAEFDLTVMACNERSDQTAIAARQGIAHVAASAMAQRDGGRVLLTASERSNGGVRSVLCSFANDITQRWSSAEVVASVSFGVSFDFSFQSEQAAPGGIVSKRVA